MPPAELSKKCLPCMAVGLSLVPLPSQSRKPSAMALTPNSLPHRSRSQLRKLSPVTPLQSQSLKPSLALL
ncbi:hypothetical protein FBU30_002590, partial [Linnemannia zychae]